MRPSLHWVTRHAIAVDHPSCSRDGICVLCRLRLPSLHELERAQRPIEMLCLPAPLIFVRMVMTSECIILERDTFPLKNALVASSGASRHGDAIAGIWPCEYLSHFYRFDSARKQVPKNEYGNVEFFDCNPVFLPPGTAHVRGDQIGRVAGKLGIDYAPALTGFEVKQGRQVPVTDGIIICKEHSQVCTHAKARAWVEHTVSFLFLLIMLYTYTLVFFLLPLIQWRKDYSLGKATR